MAQSRSIWFRIGYALESARREPARAPGGGGRLRGLRERRDDGNGVTADKDDAGGASRQRRDGARPPSVEEALDALIAAGTGTLAGRVVGLLPSRRRPGLLALLRAGAAGAGAALLRELVSPLLHGDVRLPELAGPRMAESLLAGAARGLVYGSVVEPRLPGPAAARGVLYGSLEYAVSPWGGVAGLLGDHSPLRRVPLLTGLFEDYAPGYDGYVDHLVFGLALAVLYGSEVPDASRGTSGES